jgi:hypothetical protein
MSGGGSKAGSEGTRWKGGGRRGDAIEYRGVDIGIVVFTETT